MKFTTLGIIGGGQLGQMTAAAAFEMGIKTVVFTDQEKSVASQKADQTIVANYNDFAALKNFANLCDVITYEFENIPVETVGFLEEIGKIFPSSKVLKITQNRILEKNFLNSIGVKTVDFCEIKTKEDLILGFERFGKSILKTATLGYDGKGQFKIEQKSDIEDIWSEIKVGRLTQNGLVLEKFSPFTSETSVIVARSINDEISCYDPLTNIHKDGILDQSIYPAQISEKCKNDAKKIAEKIVQEIGLFGLLAIEFFVLEDGELIVNEMAPRPHNSGHFSMDASNTSQFSQLVLAVTGQKLGDPKFHSHGYMQNLIGKQVLELEKYERDPNAVIHIYGKKEVKIGRKMGHVNILKRS